MKIDHPPLLGAIFGAYEKGQIDISNDHALAKNALAPNDVAIGTSAAATPLDHPPQWQCYSTTRYYNFNTINRWPSGKKWVKVIN